MFGDIMLFRRTLSLMLGCLIGATALTTQVQSQTTFKDTDLIPSSAIVAVFVDVEAFLNDPSMELMPREMLTALGKREMGVDPCEINSVMMLVDNVTDDRQPPGFAVTVRFDSKQTLKEDILARAEQSELRGKPLYKTGRNEPVVYLPNDKTIVIGMEPFIEKMLEAKGAKSGLIDLVTASAGEKDHVNAFVNVEPIREFLDENLPPRDQIPLPFKSFRNLPDEIESLNFRMNFTSNENTGLKINATDEDSAKKVLKTIDQALGMGRGMLLSTIANELADQPDMMEALEAYDNRAGDKIVELFKPTLEGKTLRYDATDSAQLSNVAVIGTLVGMLLPAVQQVRGAARRTQSMNNLRQMCLACLNYESAHMHFPSNIVDDDGKPLLSWRVQILPFIEENALYREFHLDEPWDSEHNIALLDRMPEVFRNPNVVSGTKTVYLGFEGEGTMFDPDGEDVGFGNITDGSSNTILCVEANEDAAIEWTKPQDLSLDKANPRADVGDLRPGGFNIVLCDGSTHFVASGIDAELFVNMILMNDGNIVDSSKW